MGVNKFVMQDEYDSDNIYYYNLTLKYNYFTNHIYKLYGKFIL